MTSRRVFTASSWSSWRTRKRCSSCRLWTRSGRRALAPLAARLGRLRRARRHPPSTATRATAPFDLSRLMFLQPPLSITRLSSMLRPLYGRKLLLLLVLLPSCQSNRISWTLICCRTRSRSRRTTKNSNKTWFSRTTPTSNSQTSRTRTRSTFRRLAAEFLKIVRCTRPGRRTLEIWATLRQLLRLLWTTLTIVTTNKRQEPSKSHLCKRKTTRQWKSRTRATTLTSKSRARSTKFSSLDSAPATEVCLTLSTFSDHTAT